MALAVIAAGLALAGRERLHAGVPTALEVLKYEGARRHYLSSGNPDWRVVPVDLRTPGGLAERKRSRVACFAAASWSASAIPSLLISPAFFRQS